MLQTQNNLWRCCAHILKSSIYFTTVDVKEEPSCDRLDWFRKAPSNRMRSWSCPTIRDGDVSPTFILERLQILCGHISKNLFLGEGMYFQNNTALHAGKWHRGEYVG